MNTLALLRGLRFVDSFFPSGGYAFSSGLEAAAAGGLVTDGAALRQYVSDLLEHGMAHREAVAAAAAHRAARAADLRTIIVIDRELDAMKVGRDTRMASRQMGRQVIRGAGQTDHVLIREYLDAVEQDRAPGHLPVSWGVVLAACGWLERDTVAGLLYQTAAGMVAAALKLLPIGQREGQQVLESWLPLIEQISLEACGRTEMHAFVPVHDIYAMRHSRLVSRLFRS